MKATAAMGQSWRLIWRRKSLLRLGLVSTVASLLAWASLNEAYTWARVESPALMERLTGIPRNPFADMWGVAGASFFAPFTIGILVICLVVWLVGLAARGSLITSVDDVEGQDAPGSGFGRALRRGPRLALMTFVLFLPVILLLLMGQAAVPNWPVLANPFRFSPVAEFARMPMNFYLMGYGLPIITFIPMLFLQLIYPFAFRGMVLRDLSIFGTILHGGRVLRGNMAEIVPLLLSFGVVHIVLWGLLNGIFIALSVFFIYAVTRSPDAVNAFLTLDFDVLGYLLLTSSITSGNSPNSIGLIYYYVMGNSIALTMLLVSVVMGTIMTAWRSAAFTIGYRRWTDDKPDNSTSRRGFKPAADKQNRLKTGLRTVDDVVVHPPSTCLNTFGVPADGFIHRRRTIRR